MYIKNNYPWISLTAGLLFSVLLMWLNPFSQSASVHMPLLMALFMAELGFIVTAAGTAVAINDIRKNSVNNRLLALAAGNLILAINLIYFGYTLWPKQGFAN